MTLEKALDDIEFNRVLDTYDFPKAFSYLDEAEEREKLFLLLQEENLNPLTGFTKIPGQFLKKCSKITKIEIPDTITSIGSSAFEDCSRLTSVVIGEGVTTIGDGAFSWCSGLTSVVIPNSMTTIDRKAFYRCDNLKEITFKGTRKEATQSGLGYLNRKKWSEGSSVEKVICNDGVIKYW